MFCQVQYGVCLRRVYIPIEFLVESWQRGALDGLLGRTMKTL